MDRRQFCKIGALALGALGVGRLESLASTRNAINPRADVMGCACRVTVMRRECYEDMQALYLDDPETGACTRFATGDVWRFAKGDSCPDGFCERAWQSIIRTINSASAVCAETACDVLVVACPDGTRPVIFRMETNV